MFIKLLFGVQNSPQRKFCVGLAIALTLIGLIIIPVQGSQDGLTGVFEGIAFMLLGLLAIAVLSRQFAARDEKVATSAQLDRLSGEYDNAALKSMVDNAPHDPNDQLGRVTGQLDGAEIRAAVDQVRSSQDIPPAG